MMMMTIILIIGAAIIKMGGWHAAGARSQFCCATEWTLWACQDPKRGLKLYYRVAPSPPIAS
jgi:hypothetical protein